jgi:hypothetical protein
VEIEVRILRGAATASSGAKSPLKGSQRMGIDYRILSRLCALIY